MRSQWASELTHPRHRPLSALAYVVGKYGWPWLISKFPALGDASAPPSSEQPPPILPETEALFHARLQALAGHTRVLVVIWPDRPTAAGDAAARAVHQEFSRHVRQQLIGTPVRLVDLLEAPPRLNDYRDRIHPSPAGNEYLASRIAEALQP